MSLRSCGKFCGALVIIAGVWPGGCTFVNPQSDPPSASQTNDLSIAIDSAREALRGSDRSRLVEVENDLRDEVQTYLSHTGGSSSSQLVASAQVQLAEVLLEVGRLQEAKERVDGAQRMQQMTGDTAGLIRSTAIQGRILARMGDLDGAITLHRQNLGRVETTSTVSPERKAWALANLGRALWAKGVQEGRSDVIAESVAWLERADALAAASPDVAPAQRWIIRSQLAEAWFDAGDTAKGEAAAQEAWNYSSSPSTATTDSPSRDSRWTSVGLTRARILLHTDHVRGLEALEEWLDSDFTLSIRNLPRLTDDEKRRMLARREIAVRLACQSAVDHPVDPHMARVAIEAVWSWKGLRVDAARRELEVLRTHGSEEERRLFTRIVRGRQALAARVIAHAKSGDAASQAELEKVGLNLRRDASSLRKGSLGRHAEGSLAPVTAEDIVRVMNPTDAVVEYVVSRPSAGGSDKDVVLLAFVIRRAPDGSASVVVRPLGNLDRISTAVRRMRSELDSTIRLVSTGSTQWMDVLRAREERLARRLAEVRQYVWEPLRPLLAGTTRAFVGVDGPLSSVPFDALPQRSGESWLYRIEDPGEPTITRIHTARDLLWWRDERLSSADRTLSRQIVLVGAPDFGAPVRSTLRSDFPTWTPVAGLEPYLQAMRDNLARSLPGASVQAWLGQDATEQRVMDLNNPAGLVLATHGWVWDSADAGALDERAGIDSTIRSMVAMQGANLPMRHDSDGLLTAFELVGGPDLRETHLIVLIACSSGVSESADDGGSLGMRRALHINGARCILASLFDVPQRQSLALMDRFQQEWMGNAKDGANRIARLSAFLKAKHAALRIARDQDGTGHPLLWAGFEYFGDPGEGAIPEAFVLPESRKE
jgi:tetratricopeptide (TPR) repeat protein